MTDVILELTDEQLDDYLMVSLANYQRVTPGERKKLKGLMAYYAKKKHPFTECVRDNTKRFGKDRAERICAVLKDLIKGTTKWRGEEKKAHLSESTLRELFEIDVDDAFYKYIEELTDEEIEAVMADTDIGLSDEDDGRILAELFFGEDDAVEENGLLFKTIFREGTWKYSPGPGQKPIEKPLTVIKAGVSDRDNLVISMDEIKENFEKGVKDNVTVPLNHDNRPHENTGYIRQLKYDTDEQGRAVLKAGFEFTEPDVKEKAKRGSIPGTSGGVLFDYINKEKGDKYRAVLDHVALTPNPWLNDMGPFGMSDDEAENLQILGFSEELEGSGGDNDVSDTKDKKDEIDATPTLSEKLGLSEDEILARLKGYEDLAKKDKERNIKDRITAWQSEGKTPAVLEVAEKVLMADDGRSSLNLSETETLSLSEVAEMFVEASASVKLSDDKVNDKDQSDDKPNDSTELENKKADLSADEKADVASLMFGEGKTEDEAISIVTGKRDSK